MVDSPTLLIEIVHLLLHLISGDRIHLEFSEATIPLRLMRQGSQNKVLDHYRNSPDRRYNRAPERMDNQVPSYREKALIYHKGQLLIQDINVLAPLVRDANALGPLIKGINVLDPLIQDFSVLDLLVSLRLRKRISLPGVNRHGPRSMSHH